jgi:FkbM family methyltransferase
MEELMNFSSLLLTEFPKVFTQWENRRIHDTDFYGFLQLQRPLNQILDVGANRGQSIVSMRTLLPSVQIHSFEANISLIPVLEKLVNFVIPPPVLIHPYGLSDEDGDFVFYIPFSNEIVYLEEASTSLEYYEKPWVKEKFRERGGLMLKEVKCKLIIGDSLSLLPEFIKVDVEGAESRVLRGLTETIKRMRPVIMVENSDWFGVQDVLLPLNYSPYEFNIGTNRFLPLASSSTNTFYFPNEAPPPLGLTSPLS